MRESVAVGSAGLALGFALSRIGFSSWSEVHAMFTFSDLRLLWTFLTAAAALVLVWWWIGRVSSPRWSPRPIHQGSLIGGLLFGVGWAISGACPAIALVQIGEGQLGALLTLVGILAGNWAYSLVHERFFRWPAASCAEG